MSPSPLEPLRSLTLRLLIVEDERVVARDLKACLEGLGYDVVGLVTSGEAAIAQAHDLRPDLIMMDIRLEGAMDGITAAQQIWTALQIPSIFTTGYSDQATVDRAIASAGMFGYILKPVRERDLYIAIKAARQRQAESQTHTQDASISAEALRVLSAIGDGVIVTDAQGRVKFLNEVAIALTGWSLTEAQNQPSTDVFRLIHLQTQVPIADPVQQVLETERSVYIIEPVLLLRADGQHLPVADSAAPLRDRDGTLVGVVVVFRDVADRELVKTLASSQQRLQLLEQQLQEVQALQTQREEFLSEASHELRTPLTSIKLAVHMLELNLDRRLFLSSTIDRAMAPSDRDQVVDRELGAADDEYAANLSRYLHILRTECDRELKLVNELLAMQHLESGRFAVQWETLYLLPWLRDQLVPYEVRAAVREQHLLWLVNGLPFTDLLAESIMLITDPDLLGHIVGELLTNACKYTPPGGDITVNVVPEFGNQIMIWLHISNTGTPIPPAVLPRLFDKFYRVPGRDQWQQGGAGLGLALVKRQVEYLGGSITVTSDDDLTTFTVALSTVPSVSN